MEQWQAINRAEPTEALRLLRASCGSPRWAARMLARRPFADRAALLAAAHEEWLALDPSDWRDAFSHHPRIGDREALRRRFPETHHLSAREQSGIAGASDAILDALAADNQRYYDRFGYIFIVCATGLRADEMLARLRHRLPNDPSVEIGIAAAEQAKITALRLGSG